MMKRPRASAESANFFRLLGEKNEHKNRITDENSDYTYTRSMSEMATLRQSTPAS
jgi:hypothetical protein